MKHALLIGLIALSCPAINAQPDTIYLHFRYGSKPAKGTRPAERTWFGGLKGGHVSIEADGWILDFLPGKNPIFPNKQKPTGDFYVSRQLYWDSSGDNKKVTIAIPVSPEQKRRMLLLFDVWDQKAPYDYAVFGMRCASACYDALSEIGLVDKLSRTSNIIRHFYPKLLRKKMLRLAEKNNWPVQYQPGRSSRKWESDRGLF